MTRQINDAGLDLIKEFESFRAEPYKDIAGIWTQGYGTTTGITEDSEAITESTALTWLIYDLTRFESAVEDYIGVELTDNQFSALVCLVYNVGTRPLQLTLGHYLNQGKYAEAADEFLCWNHVGKKVVAGLTRRREAERELFLKPDNN